MTGVGRSGTSLVARLYHELGVDPGGAWDPVARAGFESPEVVRLNRAIMRDMGVGWPIDPDLARVRVATVPGGGVEARDLVSTSAAGPAVATWLRMPARVLVPRRLRDAARALAGRATARARLRARGSVGGGGRQPRPVRWDRLHEVVGRYRGPIRDVAAAHPIAKDPRFAWTLGVWVAAGAPIEHVLVCTRDMDGIVQSRILKGDFPVGGRDDAKNALVYGLGLCFAALVDHELPHSIVRFPELATSPEHLFEAMSFPTPVTRDQFDAAFERIVDRPIGDARR